MPHPWLGPSARILRISRSSVPCNKSVFGTGSSRRTRGSVKLFPLGGQEESEQADLSQPSGAPLCSVGTATWRWELEKADLLRRSSTSCATTANKSAHSRARETLRGCRPACRSGHGGVETD